MESSTVSKKVKEYEQFIEQYENYQNILSDAKAKNVHTFKRSIAKFEKFTDLAKKVLIDEKYKEIKKYESFIFSFLTQFTNLYETYEYPLLMNIADLYIAHGDYDKGDNYYRYILREEHGNLDVYLNWSKGYLTIDEEKSRSIAHEAIELMEENSPQYSDFLDILMM